MPPRSPTRIAAALLLVGALAACLGRGEPVPRALERYLTALKAGDLRTAYDLTQLDDLAGSNPASSLTFEHFRAFYEADPLERWEVSKVTRLEQRTLESADVKGSAFYVVDIALFTESGNTTSTFHLSGDVLPTVEIDVHYVTIEAPRGGARIVVDGEPGPRVEGARTVSLLVLPGRHTLRIGARDLTIHTQPLQVLTGRARVVKEPDGSERIRLL